MSRIRGRASNPTSAVSDLLAPVTDILAGSGAASPAGDLVGSVTHAVTPLVTDVVTPITSLVDHSPTGTALSPVTNVLHGLLG